MAGNNPYWNFERLMEFEDDIGVRSTFFFMDERGKFNPLRPRTFTLYRGRYTLDDPKIQHVIRHLEAGGWEIGLHGSYRSFNDESLLGTEKGRLETILGHPVLGVRQHYLRLRVPQTWQIHARLGFAYDSSLGYTRRIGYRAGTSRPFYPVDPTTRKPIMVLEVPLTVMDRPLMEMARPQEQVWRCIEKARGEGGVLTLNWHQCLFNPWEPEDYPAMYAQIIRECQRLGAWIASIGEICARWRTARQMR
ncbi:MAG: polysaccharide deacetylase family protein [Planctomycetes bacterium]|nr:polysaccharide deacetylase family protein [Planctomycetota bacterium]